jgi:hypothetical protein
MRSAKCDGSSLGSVPSKPVDTNRSESEVETVESLGHQRSAQPAPFPFPSPELWALLERAHIADD